MEFRQEHAGKWVATRKQKVVDSAKSLQSLVKRVEKRKDRSEVRFARVPKQCIAGSVYGI